MEKIQERLIRMLSDVRGDTYEEKLRDAGLTTLKERRERGDTIQTFKVLKGFSKVELEKWFQVVPDNARPTRATTMVDGEGTVVKKDSMLVVERARLEVRCNAYPIRAAKGWNEQPEAVKNSTSVNGFKSAYDKWRDKKNKNMDDTRANNENTEPRDS